MTDRRTLIGTSWKMNLTPTAARAWFDAIAPHLRGVTDRSLFVLPPFPVIPLARDALRGTGVAHGAQDVHWADRGAHTGDVSGEMLADLGCTFAEVGHSERRRDHGETDAIVGRKAAAAIRWDMIPIVCVGERTRMAERDARARVGRSLARSFGDWSPADLDRLVIAYEPVWAIGVGAQAASVDHIAALHQSIHRWLAGRGATTSRVIYGGSVDAANAPLILRASGVDGLFVGRSALDPATFATIALTPIAEE